MSVYRRDGLPWLSVFLRSAAGAVELSTVDDSTGYKLLDGVKGLGIPSRSVESTPIPAGHGSVFRSQRFDESEVLLPISVKGLGPDRMAELRRGLESVLLVDRDEPAELIVQAPGLGTVRRRFVYYTEGLEGALGGADSHLEYNHLALRLLALDPMWWGAEQSETFRVKPARKPFLSQMRGEPSTPRLVRTNHVLNPSVVENEARAYFVGSNYQGTLSSSSTEQPHFGPTSWRLETTDTDGNRIGGRLDTDAEGTMRYKAGIWMRPGPGVERVVVEIESDQSGSWNRTAASFVSNTGGLPQEWVQVVAEESSARSGRRRVRFSFHGAQLVMAKNPIPVGSVSYVDGAVLTDAQSPVDFFDGSTTVAGRTTNWTGTPNNSSSELWTVPTGQDDIQAVPFFPIMLSSSTIQGARQIDIQGDADAYPIWTVYGPGEDFEIINRTTGERFFLEGEITSPITIDTRTEQLSADGMSNMELWARVPRELSTFPLKPGRNDISFVIVNATEQSKVELRYAEQWRAGY